MEVEEQDVPPLVSMIIPFYCPELKQMMDMYPNVTRYGVQDNLVLKVGVKSPEPKLPDSLVVEVPMFASVEEMFSAYPERTVLPPDRYRTYTLPIETYPFTAPVPYNAQAVVDDSASSAAASFAF